MSLRAKRFSALLVAFLLTSLAPTHGRPVTRKGSATRQSDTDVVQDHKNRAAALGKIYDAAVEKARGLGAADVPALLVRINNWKDAGDAADAYITELRATVSALESRCENLRRENESLKTENAQLHRMVESLKITGEDEPQQEDKSPNQNSQPK